MTSYEILKQEWFSIRNREDALRTKKEDEKFQKQREHVRQKIRNKLNPGEIKKLDRQVRKMLQPGI